MPRPIDGRLLRFEWRLFARSSAPWFVAILFVAASGAALVNGRAAWQRQHDAAQEAHREQAAQRAALERDVMRVEQQRSASGITGLRSGLPAAAAVEARVMNFRPVLPPLSAGVLAMGQSHTLPQRYELRGGGGTRYWPFTRTVGTKIMSGLFPEEPTENPSATLLGGFDLVFVGTYIYPLLILALACGVVSADREAGTLAVVAAQPLSCRRWLGKKAVVRGTFLVVFGVVLPAIAVAFAMPEWTSDSVPRLAVWIASLLVYGGFWFLLALSISMLTPTPAVSAVVAVTSWLVFVVVMPALVGLATPLLSPVSTRIAYASAERAASIEINPRVDDAITALNRLVQARAGRAGIVPLAGDRDHPSFTEPLELPLGRELLDVLPRPPWNPVMPPVHSTRALAEARRILFEQRLEPILRDLDASERREAAFVRIAQFSSPALLFQAIVEDITGTGRYRWQRFLTQLDDHVRERNTFFVTRILHNRTFGAEDLNALTPFRYQEEGTTALFARLAFPLTGLAAMAGVTALMYLRASSRWR
jgi:ABC-2 type transport system permease protein